jgi:hypothetical protein
MAWSFGDGFDLYASLADAINGYWDSGPTANAATLVAGRFSGSRAWQIAIGTNGVYLVKSSGQNDAVHHLSIAVLQNSTLTGTNSWLYLQLLDGTTAQCTVVFRSDGAILLNSGTSAGATLATYTSALTAINTWYQFEIEIVINNTTGAFRVRKNGNTSNDFDSGNVLNTRGGTANNYANKLQIGNTASANAQVIDDLFWRSDASSVAWLGDLRCYTRMPASDASVQFSRTPTGVLTQTVPSVATNTTITSATVARFTPFVAAYSGTVTSTGVVGGASTTGNMKCAIYADNAGVPGAVLASAVSSVSAIVGTNVFTFSPGVAITKGVQYWIAATEDNGTGLWTSNTASTIAVTSTVAYASFPQSNPTVSVGQATVQMSWTYTATPANWQAVSEPQQDATTSYVYDSTPGDADFYGIAAIASTPVTTFAVVTRGYMEKSDAGTRTAAVQLKSGGTTVASTTVVLTTSGWQWVWRSDLVDPNTSAAWTPAAVNNVTIGPTVIA